MSNIHFIQLADYQAPKITENKREEWVDFGEENNYYQFLIDRYNGSTTNNAVINNISKLIYGKGLTANDANRKPNEYAQMKMLFSKDTIKKIAKDLKLLGEYNLQLIYNEQKSKIVRVEHLPTNLVRSEKCDKDGVINAIYYSDNWQDIKKFPPKRIPLFGYGSKSEKLEVLRVGNYTIGQKYYSNIDYIGGISYATLEEEISNYLINDVQRGFSGRSIINFNNGVPTEEQQTIIAAKAKGKLTGSKGDPVIVSFNSDETKKTTVDKISVDNAPEHYSFLSKESLEKIMLSHNVTSPLLFGIATSTGFSANADELKNSYILFENMVIKPFQETICDGLDKVLAFNEISLDLSFEQLQPLDNEGELGNQDNNTVVSAVNSLSPLVANKVLESMTPNEIRGLVGLKATLGGSDLSPNTLMSSQEIDLSNFGEEIDLNEWELVDSRKVNYEEEERLDAELYALNNPKKSLLSKVYNFVSSGTAIPNAKSGQDGELFKSRYRYSGEVSSNSRKFCVKMLEANKVYRKEDIIAMRNQKVNEGWGPEGADTYSIWLYKGGGSCHHFWTRETYRKKADVNSPLAEQITPAKARKEGEILPTNDMLVYTKPKDMPYEGFLPTNKRFQ
jgi:hypothetical protein